MKSEEALQAYDELYQNPRTGEYIIDGDEAQVAADLAAVVRSQQQAIDLMSRQLQASALNDVDRLKAYQQGLEDRPVVDAAAEAVQQLQDPTPEQLRASIETHSPQFLEAVASDTDILLMSVQGFRAPEEARYLWECMLYAHEAGKAIQMVPKS